MKPLSEVTSQAIRLLSEHLGVADTFRFVNQFTNGHGDYTAERDTLFRDVAIDDVVAAIKKKQLRDRAATATPTNVPPIELAPIRGKKRRRDRTSNATGIPNSPNDQLP